MTENWAVWKRGIISKPLWTDELCFLLENSTHFEINITI